MFSDGTLCAGARSWPSGTHLPAAASKRLAKMLVASPRNGLGSYHDTHGTVRPAPAKSMVGASASTLLSMLSDAGEPWVRHWPSLNARTKICCSPAVFCSKVAHGTRAPPAASDPPTTSDRPASRCGSMPATGSSLTCCPGGSPGRAAGAEAAASPKDAIAAAVTAAPRREMRERMGWCSLLSGN
jgi:hypothetical protein